MKALMRRLISVNRLVRFYYCVNHRRRTTQCPREHLLQEIAQANFKKITGTKQINMTITIIITIMVQIISGYK